MRMSSVVGSAVSGNRVKRPMNYWTCWREYQRGWNKKIDNSIRVGRLSWFKVSWALPEMLQISQSRFVGVDLWSLCCKSDM